MKFLNLFFCTALLTLTLWPQQSRAYPTFPDTTDYRRDIKNPAKDSFCPRLEGNYPAQCCPYQQDNPEQCYYYNRTSVVIGTLSTATKCVNNVDTQVTCCNKVSVPCVKDLVQKQFIPRLIKRNYQSQNDLFITKLICF